MVPLNNSGRRIPRIVRTSLFITCGLLLAAGLLLLMVPNFDGHSRQLRSESAAVSTLRAILTLQDQHMAAHAGNEFACELPLLKPVGQQKFPDNSLEFLTTGVQSGYKFALASCGSDANRARVRYQVTAVPVEHGTAGVRAFCADEAGVIWFDAQGSATNCLALRHPLE
jgi:type II secretory pathway pseudopilin PulG